MDLTADGSKLLLLTYAYPTNVSSHIEIYNTGDLTLSNSFSIPQGIFDTYRGYRFTVDPTRERIYLIATTIGGG